MRQIAKSFNVSACALAAAMLVSACGGGGVVTDTTPPTVTITDNVAGATATGPVTFTFTFSEDVGTSFAAEDVVVTGGSPAATVTKVDATHYTLVVTPTANATGTINVSVAAAKFKDLALNDNTVAASAAQAYSTVVAATEPTDAPAAPTALAANVLSIYSDAYTPVAGVVLRPDWGQTTAVSEVTIAGNKVEKYTSFNYEGITFTPIDVTAMTKIHIDVWTPDLASLDVFVLAGGAEQFVNVTPTKAGWNSFDIDLSAYTTLNKAAVKELKLVANGGTTAYLDNIYFWKPAAAISCGTTEPTCAPTAPTSLAANVLSIYSDAYTPVAGVNLRPDWGQSTAVSEVTIAGNKVEKYTAFNYEGITFTPIDVTAMTKIHVDVWTPDLASLDVYVLAGGAEQFVKVTPTKAGWNSFDIDLSAFTTLNKAAVKELKLVANGGTTAYLDNIYFWKPAAGGGGGGGSGTCTAPACVDFSAAGIGFGLFENNGGSVEIASEPNNATNKVVKFVKKPTDNDYFGTTITGLGGSVVLTADKKTVTMRVFSPTIGTNFLLKFEGGSGGPATTEKDVVTTKANEWETLSFVMPDVGTYATVVLFPNGRSKVTADKTMYIDDLTFPGFSASGGGGGTPPVDMGSGGAQTLTIAAADVKTGDGGNTMFVAGEGIFAVNYVGTAETVAPFRLAALAGATTANFTGVVGVANGSIGYFQDDANLSASAQKVDELGWVTGTSYAPLGVPNFFRTFVLKGPVSNNAYMGLYVNAPNNGTVNTGNFSKIKFKVWGPGPMFERANLNPVLEMTLTGPKVAGCTTGSGGTEIKQTFTANRKDGAGGFYTLPFSGFTVKGLCGADTNANAVTNVRANLARVVMTVPGTSFNYTNLDGGNYATGVNLGAIGFTNN